MSQVKIALIEASLMTHGTVMEKHCKYAFLFSVFCVQEFSSSRFIYKITYQSINYDTFLKH